MRSPDETAASRMAERIGARENPRAHAYPGTGEGGDPPDPRRRPGLLVAMVGVLAFPGVVAAAGASTSSGQPGPGVALGTTADEQARMAADQATISRETALERRLTNELAVDKHAAAKAAARITDAEARAQHASKLASVYLADARKQVKKKKAKPALAYEKAETNEVVAATKDVAAADLAAAGQAMIVASEDRVSALRYTAAEAAAAATEDLSALRSEASISAAAAKENASLQSAAGQERTVAAREQTAASAAVKRAAQVLVTFRKELAKEEAKLARERRRHRR